jgi:hypothetical protein
MEMSGVVSQKAVQNAPIRKGSDVDTFQGLKRPILEHYTQQSKCALLHAARPVETNFADQKLRNVDDRCYRAAR